MPLWMVMRTTKWALAAQIACVGAIGCDGEPEPAPAAEAPRPAADETSDAAPTASPAPDASPSAAAAAAVAPRLDAAAETVDIDRVTAGVFRASPEAVQEVLYAFGTGAWTATPGAEGITVQTTGAPRLGVRLEIRDGDVLTGVGDLVVTKTTTAREVFEAFAPGEATVTTWLREGRPRRALYRLDKPRRSRPRSHGTLAADIMKIAVTAEPEATVERAVLAAYEAAGDRASVEPLLEALELPPEPNDVAIDGTSVVPDELARVLGEHADATAMTLSVDGEERKVKVVESTIDANDLAEHLKRGRDRGSLRRLFDEPDAPEVPTGPATELPLDAAEATEGITVTADGKIELSAKTLDGWLGDPSALAKSARIIPSMRDGVVEGYKLYGIRRSSILKALGFNNGDMVKSINGRELTSAEDALDMYADLRKAKTLEFEIVRKGARHTLEITITK